MTAKKSKTIGPKIEPDEEAAIKRLAKRWGRLWKAQLRYAWESGRYGLIGVDDIDESALQRLRNRVGPSGLLKIKTPK
jgi:hypothetical protein